MTLSIPGLIGSVLGLLLALVTYLAVMPQLTRAGTGAEGSVAKPNVEAIRMFLLADFLILAAVGYYVGQLFD